jgi:hypothetical protein
VRHVRLCRGTSLFACCVCVGDDTGRTKCCSGRSRLPVVSLGGGGWPTFFAASCGTWLGTTLSDRAW